MKKITVLIVFIFTLFSSYQSVAQLDVANWPNPDWTITGNYTFSGFTNNPTTTPNFTFDDDVAGSGSLFDDIAAVSPVIDLNPAVDAGELQIQLTLDYIFRRNGDALTIEYWNPDNGTWNLWESFVQSSSSDFDYKNCEPFTAFTSVPLVISTFTATQLLGFKYRLRYNDNGWSFGFCFGSPTLSSIETPTCFDVINIIINEDLITNAEAVIDWTDINVVAPNNGWEIEYGETGFTQGSGTIVAAAIHPFTISGLDPNTVYDVYVRTLCNDTDISEWTGPVTFITAGGGGANDECGGQYVDSGGLSGNYSSGEDITTVICPEDAGDVVTVNFLSFDTESGFDNLTIYDGDSDTAPLLGEFDGTDLPPIFTSTHATGCLTFVFHSDSSITRDGWVANIICSPPPTCFAVSNLNITAVTDEQATITWVDNNEAPEPLNGWQVEIVTSGSTPLGVGDTATSPYIVNGLNQSTIYDVYVRAICDDNGSSDASFWIASSFETLKSPPKCGEIYVDSGGIEGNYFNDENETFVICPDVTGELVTLQFVDFNTDGGDVLSIYDGASTSAPLLGAFSGNNLPPTFTSTDGTGCITVEFISNGFTNASGWLANVFCGPPPSCLGVENIIVSNIQTNSAQIDWVDINVITPIGGWDIEYGIVGYEQGVDFVGFDTNIATTQIVITGLIPSTDYDVYVRVNCAADDSDSSFWFGPIRFKTDDLPPPNDTCATAIPMTVGALCEDGVVLGNNILATSSTDLEGEIVPDCTDPAVNGETIGGVDYDSLDVWFSFTVETTTVAVLTHRVLFGMADPIVAAYRGTCGNLEEIVCQDDNDFVPNDFPELVLEDNFVGFELKNLTVGETIYLRVWSYPEIQNSGDVLPNVTGAFEICVFGQSRAHSGPLDIEDVNVETQLTYYPNPVNDILTVKSTKEISNISIYTILGQEVVRKTFTNEVNVTINIETLSTGTYFAKALIEGEIQTFKIIKK